MSKPSLRQTIMRSGSSSEADTARGYENEIISNGLFDRGLMNFGSSRRYQPLNAMSRTVLVPLTRGQPKLVVLRPKDKVADLQTGIDVGFETGQLTQSQTAVRQTSGLARVNGGSRRTHEEIKGPGSLVLNPAGHFILKTGGIAVSGGGRSPVIDIPGALVNRPNFTGFNGTLRTNAEMNNPNFTNAAITVKGAPQIHNARTGNFVVGRQSFGAIAESAARHAVNETFHAPDGVNSFNTPSLRAIQHAVSAHTKLGTAPAVYNTMSAAALAQIRAEMHMQYGNARVKPEEPRPT